MTKIVVDLGLLDAMQSKLNQATEQVQEANQNAKTTLDSMHGGWQGEGADKYEELLTEITNKMAEASKVYEEMSDKVSKFSENMINADKTF